MARKDPRRRPRLIGGHGYVSSAGSKTNKRRKGQGSKQPKNRVKARSKNPEATARARDATVFHKRVEAVEHEPTTSQTPPATTLTWEILPPGWWHNLIRHTVPGKTEQVGNPEKADAAPKHEERIHYLASLVPAEWYEGSHLGERVYYVAIFGRTAVAECLDHGNALYVYSGPLSWKTVFQQSKREALRMGARRIVHAGDWRRRLIHRLHAGQFQYRLDL